MHEGDSDSEPDPSEDAQQAQQQPQHAQRAQHAQQAQQQPQLVQQAQHAQQAQQQQAAERTAQSDGDSHSDPDAAAAQMLLGMAAAVQGDNGAEQVSDASTNGEAAAEGNNTCTHLLQMPGVRY